MIEEFTDMFRANDTEAEETPGDEQSRSAADTDTPETGDDPLESEAWTSPETDGEGGAAADATPDVTELDARLDELEEEIDSTESSVRAIQSSQQDVADTVEEVNDTVRRLVGVYDRLAAEENPFVDAPDELGTSRGASDEFAVDAGANDAVYAGRDIEDRTGSESTADGGATDDEGVVSFEDLRERGEDTARTAGSRDEERRTSPDPAGSDASDEPERDPFLWNGEGGAETASTPSSADERVPVLDSMPEGYAGDVLVMEWLATLMAKSGPAGALRAVEHYEDVGWIAPAVRDRLVDVIGGPSLDVFVDPMQPCEPTAEELASSYEYIRVLNRLNEL